MADLSSVTVALQAALDEANLVAVDIAAVKSALEDALSEAQLAAQTSLLPSWVPQPGQYADIPAVNTPEQAITAANPGGGVQWFTTNCEGIFSNWSGGFYTDDYSALGAVVYTGGGHPATESGLSVQIHDGNMLFDLSALTWKWVNSATRYFPFADSSMDVYGQRQPTLTANDGLAGDLSVFVPHTFWSCQSFPKAWGGGQKGGAFRCCFAGANTLKNTAWTSDLSQPYLGMTKLVPILYFSGTLAENGLYPITAIDHQRRGWWVGNWQACDRILFVAADGTVTTYSVGLNTGGSVFGRDPQRDVLVRLDTTNVIDPLYVYELDCANPLAAKWTRKTLLMDSASIPDRTYLPEYRPNPNKPTAYINALPRAGLEWSTLLNGFVQFQDGQTNGQPPSRAWVWVLSYDAQQATYVMRREELSAQAGTGSPSYAVDSNNHPIYNGAYNRFREVPALRCFVWASSGKQKPQAFRLRGM